MWYSHRVKVGQDGRHLDQFVMYCYRKCVRNIVCCLKCNVIAFDIVKAGKGYWRRLSVPLSWREVVVLFFFCVFVCIVRCHHGWQKRIMLLKTNNPRGKVKVNHLFSHCKADAKEVCVASVNGVQCW